MEEIKFRKLMADEIDVRIGRDLKNGYVELLCYKNARVDMRLLDEKFGVGGWQVDYKGINGVLFCGIGIKDEEGEWIWKWNAGAESNIEKEKGAASDSFKRAGFCLGIGRELYTAPRVIVQADKYDTFSVAEIKYDGDRISELKIVNKNGDTVFPFPGGANTRWCNEKPEAPTEKTNAEKLKDFCTEKKATEDTKVLKKFYDFYVQKINGFEHCAPATLNKIWDKWKNSERS